jgi:hypothetical protein
MANNRINITHSYDEGADVLYVRISGDQEPTFVENVDDVLLLEVGWFSGLPKGFRVLGPKYHDIQSVTAGIRQIKKQVHQLMEQRRKAIKEQEPVFASFCDKLPSIFASAQS